MTITRLESTFIPRTKEGEKFAFEYREKLLDQGCLEEFRESTTGFTIMAKYTLDVKED